MQQMVCRHLSTIVVQALGGLIKFVMAVLEKSARKNSIEVKIMSGFDRGGRKIVV